MHWRKKHLNASKLYLVLDTGVCSYDQLFKIAVKAIEGGIDILQLRDKSGTEEEILRFIRRLKPYTDKKVLFILNDNAVLAEKADMDGVHLGQEDAAVKVARQVLDKSRLVGLSAQKAEHLSHLDGVDYIGFGSVFKTETKPDRNPMDLNSLADACQKAALPLFAIGGIDQENIKTVVRCGVQRIAVTRAILKAEDVVQATRELKHELV